MKKYWHELSDSTIKRIVSYKTKLVSVWQKVVIE